MANVLFTRAPLSEIEDVQTTQYPVTDGQLLFDTSGSGKMYMDVGTSRLEMGGAMTIDSKLNSTSTNPIQNKAVGGVMLSTLDEINAATSKGFITDALATRALAQKIGTTDISSIGDGTCTGAISSLNANNIISSSKVSITLGSISNNINYLDKVNNIVICNIGLVLPSDTETTLYQNSVIGSIPDGYSPKNVVYISMKTRQNSWVIIGFSNDGNIFIQRFDSLGEQRLININASWVVK